MTSGVIRVNFYVSSRAVFSSAVLRKLLHVATAREKPYGATEFGDRLFAARRRMGWSQEELGKRSGLGRVVVLDIEKGGNQGSSWKTRERLAQGFGVAVPDLVLYLEGKSDLDAFVGVVNAVTKSDSSHDRRHAVPHELQQVRERAKLESIGNRLFVAKSVIVLLTDEAARAAVEDGMAMEPMLPEKVVSAAWGVTHVLDCPFETCLGVARDLYERLGPERDTDVCNAKWFLDQIVDALKTRGTPNKGSGTYPSSGKLKATKLPSKKN